MRIRQRKVETGQKELAGLQHNRNEIGLSYAHEICHKWEELFPSLGWHRVWQFQGAVGWHGLTDWAGQPMEEMGQDGEAVGHSGGGEDSKNTQEEPK